MAIGRNARTPAASGWNVAKWLAINAMLIAFTAWLYLTFLIPRYIDQVENRPSGGITDNLPEGNSPAAKSDRIATHRVQERRRLRREQEPATPAELAELTAIGDAIKRGDMRCIQGRAYRYERTASGTTIVDTRARCRAEHGPN